MDEGNKTVFTLKSIKKYKGFYSLLPNGDSINISTVSHIFPFLFCWTISSHRRSNFSSRMVFIKEFQCAHDSMRVLPVGHATAASISLTFTTAYAHRGFYEHSLDSPLGRHESTFQWKYMRLAANIEYMRLHRARKTYLVVPT